MAVNLSRKRFLVVDDFAQMRSTLRNMLSAYGVTEIDVAANGDEALQLIERGHPDVVLCDYNLGPGKNGQQVLEEAKHKGLIDGTTVFVMITAENTSEMVIGAMEYRPDDYLAKPFNKGLLHSRLTRLLEKKSDMADIDKAVRQGDLRQAICLCDERINAGKGHASEFLRLKGEFCLQLGDHDAAEATYEQVLAARRLGWAVLGQAKVAYLRGDCARAIQLCEEVIAENRSFMEAYDWLAKALQRQGDLARAQDVLSDAVKLSPMAVPRQRALGDVAAKNKDFAVAEGAYRAVLTFGRQSLHHEAGNYTRLAKALSSNAAGREALKVLQNLRKEFRSEPTALLQASLGEVGAYRALGLDTEAASAFDEAGKRFEALGGEVPRAVTLEMANGLLLTGEKEKGLAIMRSLVRNNHEDEQLLAEVQEAFSEAGLEEEGREIIAATRNEVVRLNNQGVELARRGQLEAAMQLFEEALLAMPENRAINLNTAQVMLAHMQEKGATSVRLEQVRACLDRVRTLEPTNPSLLRLAALHEKLAREMPDG